MSKVKIQRNKRRMKFENLDPKSLRVLYDMTFYLGENNPEDLFNERIYEQLIKTKTKENMVELISSDDFFSILKEHKIIKNYKEENPKKIIFEKIKEDLKELLWLDPQYNDLLMMK